MKSKFNFDEIVKIISTKPSLAVYNGKLGIIKGKSQSEEKPNLFAYSVDVINENGEIVACKFIFESDLKATGKDFASKTEYVGTAKVRVDPRTGEGELVNEDEG